MTGSATPMHTQHLNILSGQFDYRKSSWAVSSAVEPNAESAPARTTKHNNAAVTRNMRCFTRGVKAAASDFLQELGCR